MRQGYRNYSVFGYRPLQASGGTTSDILVNGRPFRVHRFLSTGSSTFTMHNQGNTEFIEYLVIGGGGGGGSRHGGGGGAGGVVSGSLTMDGTSQYGVTVGAGGSGGVGNGTPSGSGGQSSFAGYLALGGGGGGQWAENLSFRKDNGDSGGSGGGASNPVGTTANGGNSDFGQGFRGGNQPNNGAAQWMGAGGGGAGGVGGNASNGTSGTGGNGGVGISSSITGSAVMYAGGGGGGGRDSLGTAGAGGAGGGGNGGSGAVPTATPEAGSPGSANTGGGGGGARDFPGGGAGGSGVVIVRYPIGPPVPASGITATGGTVTDISVLGLNYRVHTFNSSGTFTVSDIGSLGNNVEYLAVAGGGGGSAGGGGAGGLATGAFTASAIGYNISIGNGGSPGDSITRGGNGGDTSIFPQVGAAGDIAFLNGGGGGGHSNGNDPAGGVNGASGGSGGGGGMNMNSSGFGGSGIAGQGFSGGDAEYTGNAKETGNGGGGGGAGGPGKTAAQGGGGGLPVESSITGSTVQYAYGGGVATPSMINTGSGGAPYSTGRNGTVILRYRIP